MKIHTLIVDDDPNWQKIISKFVEMHPSLSLVGVCDSAMNAYARMTESEVDLLICTDVAARGLDIKDVPAVFNIDIPFNAEDYIHRIGRSGRYGRKGVSINFIVRSDVSKMRDIEQFYHTQIKEMPEDVADLL